MSFVRSKKVKGHTYYYLVSSHRVNGRVVQKFEKYIGKTRVSAPTPKTQTVSTEPERTEN